MSSFDFDSAYSAVTGDNLPSLYIPTVEHDDAHDITIDGIPRKETRFDGWDALTGNTGQYGYRGAVMHPSETVEDDTLREWVREAGGDTFAIVECRDDDGSYPDTPIGWVVIYQRAEVTA